MILKYTGKKNYAPKLPAVLSGAGATLGKPSIEDYLVVRIDSREQNPLEFPDDYCKAGRGTVDVFDYCLEGDTDWAVERKSREDFIQAVALSSSWRRELAKIAKAQSWLLPVVYVCEFHYKDIGTYDYARFASGRVTPQYIRRRVAELIYDHGVEVAFMGDRETAAYFILTLLKRRKESLKQRGAR